MIAAYFVLGLLAVLSAVLLTGRGSFLIAGYNTASSAEKAKYDAKKLCRAVGTTLLLVTVATAGLLLIPSNSVYSTPYFVFYFIFILAAVGFTLYFANKKCYKENSADHWEKNLPDTKKKPSSVAVAGICLATIPVLLLIGVSLYQASRPPVFTVSKSSLQISSAFGETIPLNRIRTLKIVNSLPENLRKTNGSDFGSILKGKFSADGQDAEIFVNAASPPFLFMETTGGLLIINDSSREKTEALYRKLRAYP